MPNTGTSAPAGWAALPVFERQGAFVASGVYHLPLFQGVPSRYIIQVRHRFGYGPFATSCRCVRGGVKAESRRGLSLQRWVWAVQEVVRGSTSMTSA